MNLTPFRNNYRKELVNQATEKLHLLLNKIGSEVCSEISTDNVFNSQSISGYISKVERINNEIILDIDYYEYEKEYCTVETLDTTTLEKIVFNNFIGYGSPSEGVFIKLD